MISFVTSARNEGSQLRRTLLQLLGDADQASEILCLNDGSTDGCFDSVADLAGAVRFLDGGGLGVAASRNALALHARGEYLVFVDAHMTLPRGWWRPLIELLDRPGVGAVQPSLTDLSLQKTRGYGQRIVGPSMRLDWLPKRGAEPYCVPALCGCCFAMRRDIFMRVGGLDGGMYGWGAEDCEMSIRLWRLGYSLLVHPEIVVGHLFRKKAPYTIDWDMVIHNNLRAAIAHLSEPRVVKVMEEYSDNARFDTVMQEIEREDIWAVRSWMERNACRDDNWYLAMSGTNF